MDERFVSLLRQRTSPPAVPTGFVRRARLESRLTEGVARPVTLVSAGPGYGKTLTMASWDRLNVASGVAAWLTIDETDNDPQAFWSDVLAALTIGDVLPPDSVLREVVPAAGFGALEAQLIRAGLAELPTAVTLVLDDFHHIRDRRVLDSIVQLLEHQPPQLRLVLATRADPALRLHRLRVNGDVTDIRADDLAFTASEVAELFDRNGIHLTNPALEMMLDRTQGWPAVLRLAIMCLDPADIDRGISRFTGSDRLVGEYLVEEVTDRLPDTDRQFLLTTSVADRLNSGLANALTGRDDAQLILERLVSQNALVVGLAGRNEWFSVHPLLRELLQHRLTMEHPGAVTDLRLRASRWFTAQGEPIPAIQHASAAGQWDEVGRLLTAIALPLMVTPGAPALAAALEPAAARARVHPTSSTLLSAAVCHYHRHDYESMARDANDAAALIGDMPEADRAPAEVAIAVSQLAGSRTRNPARTVQCAARVLDLLERIPRHQLPASEQYRAIATTNLAVGQIWTGRLSQAQEGLSIIKARSHELGLGLTEMTAEAHLALLDVIHGRLPDAHRRIGVVRDVARRRGWTSEPQALALYAASALLHLERNQLDAAAMDIDSGLSVSNSGSDMPCRLVLHIAAVGVAVACGDVDRSVAAAARLDRIQTLAGALPPMLGQWCAVAHADVHLAAGEPGAVIDALGAADEPEDYPDALTRIVQAKAHLMLNQPDAAFDLLEPRATSLSYLGPAVEARVLIAVAADRMHRDTAAMAAITQAVDLAQAAGIVRPFMVNGLRATGLLVRQRHVVARHLEFTGSMVPASTGESGSVGTPTAPVDGLTERELAVLTYLPTMLKSAEIAADLFVTVNTVKSHQRAIYRKLGVASRREAVDRARDLKLL